MPTHYLYLIFAIVAETIGTTALQASQQFTKFWPSVLVIVALIAAFIINYPWWALALIGWGYLGLMPFSYLSHRRHSRQTPDLSLDGDSLDINVTQDGDMDGDLDEEDEQDEAKV